MAFRSRHGDRSRWAGRNACPAARATRCIDGGLRHPTQRRTKSNRAVITALPTHPAFDFALGQTRAANNRTPRPGRGIRHAVQGLGRARAHAGATLGAAALFKAHLRKTTVACAQDAFRTGIHAGTAARAAVDEIAFGQRPRWPRTGALRRRRHLAAQKESTPRIDHDPTPHLSPATRPAALV